MLTSVVTADTIVLAHPISPVPKVQSTADLLNRPEILEKPGSKAETLRMLLELNGKVCEVVTGVTLGAYCAGEIQSEGDVANSVSNIDSAGIRRQVRLTTRFFRLLTLRRSMEERTFVHFADNSQELLEAYAQSGEGIDRAGGFAIQVCHNRVLSAQILTRWICRASEDC